MRKLQFAEGELYHICGRGNEKQKLFHDSRDWVRFLFLAMHFQSSYTVSNISRTVTRFLKAGYFGTQESTLEKILKSRVVSLHAFTIMPNHFHFIVSQERENGVSEYMHKVLMAYAKYFNEKYKHSGHVFQGPFRAAHISSNEQLLHVSAYVHRNQRELTPWKDREEAYPYSSYRDYVRENRWSNLLETEPILCQFETPALYRRFVETSGVKENKEFVEEDML